MNPIAKAYWIAKGVGFDNVPRRVLQAMRTRTGWLRSRMAPERFEPAAGLFPDGDENRRGRWSDRRARFLPIPGGDRLRTLVPDDVWEQHVTVACEQALAGEYPFFSRWTASLGWPPDFNRDPVNGIEWPVGPLWTETARSGPPRDDIKLVWEPSRLSLAYLLARQYRRSGDRRYADAGWELIEAWLAQNPVNRSVAWGCGQEVAFRLMAILLFVVTVLDDPSTTEARLAATERLCWQSAKRIEPNINYALSQKNNHGLSEAAGLWTVGVLFPEFPESSRWVRKGARHLANEARRQVASDGSYVQNSMSYHRVMLDDLCWVMAIARRSGTDIDPFIAQGISRATEWLREFVDAETGRVPNYGANDGANVLPLSCTDYLDYRPTLRAAGQLLGTVDPSAGPGVWDEKALWLTGEVPAGEPEPPARSAAWSAPVGGYFVLRGPSSRLFVRATTHRDRPGQCDLLHADLWYRGVNVFRDGGSYRYYHEDPQWKRYFYSVEAHNTVQVEGSEQMEKGPHFLWFRWPVCDVRENGETELAFRGQFFTGSGYVHHRRVERDGDTYMIADRVEDDREFVLRWRLAPEWDWRFQGDDALVAVCDGREMMQIQIESKPRVPIDLVDGWESLYYGERTKCPTIVCRGLRGEVRTFVSPGGG